ncbi:chemotaxis protein CheW [Paenibacillus sp. FSL H8-0259]|uniref:chemotaxis protein CheW n=1 Tax=Paenibacillus sp. FSL H8-0259 TaxID=1920423 RepID=UPI00096ED801|nr:chemotaxis protein CheW [Paenibacillus sp. FSL H8-0259]
MIILLFAVEIRRLRRLLSLLQFQNPPSSLLPPPQVSKFNLYIVSMILNEWGEEMTVRRLLPVTDTEEVGIVEFLLGNDLYCTYVQQVREVINTIPVTPVPLAHPYMEGLIQFRGEAIAVIDLAKCFGYPSARRTGQIQGKYIIAEMKNNKAAAFHVHEALRINQFNPAKMNQTIEAVQVQRGFSQRIVQVEGKLLVLLDFEKVIETISAD